MSAAPPIEIVVADVGGTHVRLALAGIVGGRVASISAPVTLRVAEHADLPAAWRRFGATLDRPLPRAAAIAVACPVGAAVLRLTNNAWEIDRATVGDVLAIDRLTLCNDFAAVGHAVAQLDAGAFAPLCGPDRPLPARGVVSIVGPGTGLGVAQVIRHGGGYTVGASEGGHSDFAPLDDVEDALLADLRRRFGRVSVERIVSGPGLLTLYAGLAARTGGAVREHNAPALWAAALGGTDPLAVAALDRFCRSLGSVAGDIALTHGSGGVVIAGGLGLRLAAHLPGSGFGQRFVAKGRFADLMAALPVKLLVHPEPGLFGAAAAFAQEHG